MTRPQFLKNFLKKGLLVSLFPGKLLELRELEKKEIYECYIAGFRFYKGPGIIGTINEGDELDLIREPENELDPYAVAIYRDNEKLGFLPMADNLVLANILDKKLPVLVSVKKVFPDQQPWKMCLISILLVYPKGYLSEMGRL